jgi:hypothetical protein
MVDPAILQARWSAFTAVPQLEIGFKKRLKIFNNFIYIRQPIALAEINHAVSLIVQRDRFLSPAAKEVGLKQLLKITAVDQGLAGEIEGH